MSDWEAMVENIERATRASEAFQEAGANLVVSPDHEAAEAFARRLAALQAELAAIQRLFSSGRQAVSDEIAELFSQVISGRSVAYRTTPAPLEARRDAESEAGDPDKLEV